jgi:DtxR family transcriptional regulator, Mn-dependent transcriptional regulator
MGVSAPSATGMLKKLSALGLVEHVPYRGAELTKAGERAALELVRHHRLLEQYLAETLGLSIDAVHAEAHRLEHRLSEDVEARIDASLGFPSHDPHGHPIPDRSLKLAEAPVGTLAGLEPGVSAVIQSVPDGDPALLRYLSDLQLVPGARVELCAVAPFDGPVTVRAGGREHAISRGLAGDIGVIRPAKRRTQRRRGSASQSGRR